MSTQAIVFSELRQQYKRLHTRYQHIQQGKAIWRQYNRQTHRFETCAEALEEIQAKLTEMEQLMTSSSPLVLQWDLNAYSVPDDERETLAAFS